MPGGGRSPPAASLFPTGNQQRRGKFLQRQAHHRRSGRLCLAKRHPWLIANRNGHSVNRHYPTPGFRRRSASGGVYKKTPASLCSAATLKRRRSAAGGRRNRRCPLRSDDSGQTLQQVGWRRCGSTCSRSPCQKVRCFDQTGANAASASRARVSPIRDLSLAGPLPAPSTGRSNPSAPAVPLLPISNAWVDTSRSPPHDDRTCRAAVAGPASIHNQIACHI